MTIRGQSWLATALLVLGLWTAIASLTLEIGWLAVPGLLAMALGAACAVRAVLATRRAMSRMPAPADILSEIAAEPLPGNREGAGGVKDPENP